MAAAAAAGAAVAGVAVAGVAVTGVAVAGVAVAAGGGACLSNQTLVMIPVGVGVAGAR